MKIRALGWVLIVPLSLSSSHPDASNREKRFQPLRPPLLGYSIERHREQSIYRLVSHAQKNKVLLEGTLDIDSAPNRGVTLILTVPY